MHAPQFVVIVIIANFAIDMKPKPIYEKHPSPDNRPHRLGVALSGGGARGLAHAGALKAIEDAGLKPDIISGVSAGSIVAVLYGAGVKPERILDMFSFPRFSDFTDFALGKGGIFKIEKFIGYITTALGRFKNLEHLRIPVTVCATNLEDGDPESFTEGPIGPRIQASCSIPIAFPPVVIDGVKYVDGGVLRNLPAWAIRDNCRHLIGINVSPMQRKDMGKNSIFDIALRTYSLLAKSNLAQDASLCDIHIAIDGVSDHKVFDLNEIEKVYTAGYEATRKALLNADINFE